MAGPSLRNLDEPDVKSTTTILSALMLGASPPAAIAQNAPASAASATPATSSQADDQAGADEQPEDAEQEIVVTGAPRREPGAVIGDIPPEVQLRPGDIRSYGVSTVTELLGELAPQTGSGQGRGGEAPAVLLNGHRISGLREIRDIPTEAILRVDILPEEVALKYGYRPDQKVVNFVLRRRFRALTGEASAGISTEDGGASGSADANLLRIQGDGRLNLDAKYQRSAKLLESQRDILPSAPRRPYDFAGNVTAPPGAESSEIDPALSALAGETVTVAGVPDGVTGRPALADFAGIANVANLSDTSRYRTLRPESDQLSLNAVLNRPVFGDVSATVNASFEASGSEAVRGVPGATLLVPAGNPFSPFGTDVAVNRYLGGAAPLSQRTASETAHAGLTLNGDFAQWHWTVTGNFDRTTTRTTTTTGVNVSELQSALDAADPAVNPFGLLPTSLYGAVAADRARSVANTGDLALVVNGSPAKLPAGDISTTLKLGAEASGFDTRSLRAGVERDGDLSRRDANGQVNVDVPLTSRRRHVLAAIGDLSANGNAAIDQLSDFGTLKTWGYGLTWKPRDPVTLIWSVANEEGAPSVQQLGNPQVLTPDVRVFDYLTGTTVEVARLDGGNPALLADNRRVTKFGLTLKPLAKADLTVVANYVSSRTRNAIASLPAATAAIEAAFPDRFLRDETGVLRQIDNRPLNFARESRRQLRWGFNFSKQLRSSTDALAATFRARRQAGDGAAAPDGADRPGGRDRSGYRGGNWRGGGRGGFGGGGGGGRLQFAVYHTWMFRDDILIRDGVPVLDLLDGAASGSGGGQPRHRIEAQAGVSKSGLGLRLNGNWQSGTVVRGGSVSPNGDLFFSDLATANLRLFANLGQMPAFSQQPWARGMRVTLSVNNLFDSRQRVRDATGLIPTSYQPGYLDPLGREVRVTIRKLFF